MIGPNDCILVMGMRGCGKTFLAKNLQKIWPRKIILDPLNEYSEGETVYSFHEYADKLSRFKSLNQTDFTIVFKFDPEIEGTESEFDHVLRLAYYFGNVLIVIEEVQQFSDVHRLPKWLKNCLLTGRHSNLALMFTSQRPGMVNKTIISQCSHIFCGKIVEGNDLRYVSNFLNENSERLISLPDRHFLYFSKEGVKEILNDFSAG